MSLLHINEINSQIMRLENRLKKLEELAASAGNSSRITPNPEKGSVTKLFKLYNLNPNDYIYSRLIEDLELLLEKGQANGETPFKFSELENIFDKYLINVKPNEQTFRNVLQMKTEIVSLIMKHKENPVPSLDNFTKEEIGYLTSLIEQDLKKDSVFKDIKELLLSKLKNGLTTDKGQLTNIDINNLIKSVKMTFGNKVACDELVSKLELMIQSELYSNIESKAEMTLH